MTRRPRRFALATVLTSLLMFAGFVPPASAAPVYEFATPVFGLAAAGGTTLFVADAGSGIVRLRDGAGKLIVDLPGVTDVAPTKSGRMWALTSGGGGNRNLYKVVDGDARMVANVGKFEKTVNPDEGEIDSNPFDLATLSEGRMLIADAAANAILILKKNGKLDWVATLPEELVPTDNAKTLAGCPNPPKEFADVCELPDEVPAQPVTTSVAVGPDGAFYVTELKGFPGPVGRSQIWRIEPGTRHVACDASATDSPCSVVAEGFTSIVDLTFGADGTAYVTEIDEASWLAVEFDQTQMAGGTVNSCTTAWVCTELATDLTMPIAVAEDTTGQVSVAVAALISGEADVVPLP
jgi:hypothetical protein